jgi:hypothetical protein
MSGAYAYKPDLLAPYLALDQGGKIQAECEHPALATVVIYAEVHIADVWIDGDGGLRSKTTVRAQGLIIPLIHSAHTSSCFSDRRQEGHRHWPAPHLGLRRLVHQPGSGRQLGCLPPPRRDFPGSVPWWRQHHRHGRVLQQRRHA